MSYEALLLRVPGKMVDLGGYTANSRFKLNYSAFLRYVLHARQQDLGRYTQEQLASEIMDAMSLATPELRQAAGKRIINVNDISKGINVVRIRRVPYGETLVIYTNWWNTVFRRHQQISPTEFIKDFLEAPDMPHPEGDEVSEDLSVVELKPVEDISLREYQRWSDWIDSWYELLQSKRVEREQRNKEKNTVLRAISQPPSANIAFPGSPEEIVLSLAEDPTISSSKLAELAAILLRKAEEGAIELSQQQVTPLFYEVKPSRLGDWVSVFTVTQYVYKGFNDLEDFAEYLGLTLDEAILARDGRIPAKSRSLEEVASWLSEKLRDAQGNPLSPSFFLSFLNGESDGVRLAN